MDSWVSAESLVSPELIKIFEPNRTKDKPPRAEKRVATCDFCGFWAPKRQIFTNMTPLLLFMINTIMLHVIVKFGCARSKIVDFMLKNPIFRAFFAIISKSHFAQTKNTKVN